MDDGSKELMQITAEAGVEAFFRTVAGPLVEAGAWGADAVRWFRFKRQVKTVRRAMDLLEEADVPPRAVSWKVLVPLLENAGLEDDGDETSDPEDAESMQIRWAALLANAAAGDSGARVPPGFPRILSEIEALDARLLEMIVYTEQVSLAELFERVGTDMSDDAAVHRVQVRIDNLERLQLCTVYRPDPQLIDYAQSVEAVENAGKGLAGIFAARPLFAPQRHQPTTDRMVEVTALGEAFIRACTPPARAETVPNGPLAPGRADP